MRSFGESMVGRELREPVPLGQGTLSLEGVTMTKGEPAGVRLPQGPRQDSPWQATREVKGLREGATLNKQGAEEKNSALLRPKVKLTVINSIITMSHFHILPPAASA